MATQYTSVLKLALPTQGELSGSWGNVVNDNITSMIEQAIAGLAVINTWSSNSHTLTSANGVTSESRCAMLSITDSSSALGGAASVICPALAKTYIVKNSSGQVATLKTASGTGIAVPNGKSMLLFCDGTNVVEAVDHVVTMSAGTLTITGLTTFASMKGADATTVTGILDEDNMASNSATKLATQQSIKAYVDSQVDTVDTLTEVLAQGNTTSGENIEITTTDKVQFRDAAIYINSSADGQLDIVADTEIQIVSTTVDLNGNLDVSGTALVTGVLTTTATQVATGGITSGSNIVSDTDSTDDLGTTSVRWANLFVDGITATDQITATGFTGTLDGILGSGAAAAATVTTLDTSGAVNLNLVTDSSSSTSGALIVDGGVGIAKKLYVGTDLDVDGTTNLDAVDIDGAVQADGTVTVGVDDTGYDVKFFGATSGAYMLWDESADDLILAGAGGLVVAGAVDFNGDLDVDGTTNLDVVDIDGAVNMATTALVTGVLTTTAATVFTGGFAAADGSTISTADNTTQLTLISTDADSVAGPVLELYRNASSPGDDDLVGEINYQFQNDGDEKTIGLKLSGVLLDASDGTEDGGFTLETMTGGTLRSRIETTITEVVFNEDSQDLDFRVETNGVTDALFVDGGNNNVNIGSTDQGGVRLGQLLNLTQTANFGGMSLSCYSTTNSHRHLLDFNKSGQATPGSHGVVADGEHLGSIFFRGDDGDEFIDGAQISAVVDGTPGNGDMPTMLTFSTTPDGAAASSERLRITNAGLVGIGAASPSSSFRTSIYGDGSSIIGGIEFRNAASGGATFTVGHASATSPSGTINVVEAGNLTFNTTNAERARFVAAGEFCVGTAVGVGEIANVQPVTAGRFRSFAGAQSAANNTATTMVTLPAGFATYIVNLGFNGVNNAGAYGATAIIHTDGTTTSLTQLVNPSNMTISLSGMAVQGTQTSGATLNISFSILRM